MGGKNLLSVLKIQSLMPISGSAASTCTCPIMLHLGILSVFFRKIESD